MGKKDWSHLRNEHKSRFAKRQLEEETSLVKSSTSTNQSIENRDEWLEDTLLKETEVIESSVFPEPVKQVEEPKNQPALGTEKAIDEQKEVLLEDSPDRPLTSQPPTQDAIEQFPKGEERVEHQGGSRLISEADLASIGMDNHQDTRSHSDTMESSPSSSKEGIGSLLRFFGWFALLMAFVFVLQNEVNKSSSSSSSSEGINGLSRDGIRTEYLTSENSSYIASTNEFQFQPTYEKAMSLIPNFAVEEKKTSFGTVDPQDVVAALGKARSGEAKYSGSSSSPFLLTLDYQSKDADGKVLLEKTGAFYRISLLSLKHLKSDRFANKNGSLTKDDFATIKVGMPYLDLLNTVGIPDEIYVSGLLGYGEAPSFTYRLSDSQTVQIHFDSRQTIKDIKSKEVATTPASSTSTAQ